MGQVNEIFAQVDERRQVRITKTCPYNIQRFFSAVKIENFVVKFLTFFYFLAQNIDCRYTLEPTINVLKQK